MKPKRGVCRDCRRPIVRDRAGFWLHEGSGMSSGFREVPTWFGIGTVTQRHEAKPLRYLNGKWAQPPRAK